MPSRAASRAIEEVPSRVEGQRAIRVIMLDVSKLERRIQATFRQPELLREALTHRSYLNENPDVSWPHNERLEFLGDAALEVVVTDALFRQFSQAPEGEMTNWRAALVRTETLASVAERLGIHEFLLLSRGEAKDTGRARLHILANTVEAIIGALYLDQGLEGVRAFVEREILPLLPSIVAQGLAKDFKSRFQEEAQERDGITPTYEVVEEWGPDHARNFRVAVLLEEERVAEGEGASKQEAQQKAAEAALVAKGWF